MPYCVSCGSPYQSEKFCPTCGNNLQVAPSSSTSPDGIATATDSSLTSRLPYFPTPEKSETTKLAGFWWRVLALLLDSLLLGIFESLVADRLSSNRGVHLAINSALLLAYSFFLLSKRGRTLGMNICRLQMTALGGGAVTTIAVARRQIYFVALNVFVGLTSFFATNPVATTLNQTAAQKLQFEEKQLHYVAVAAVFLLPELLSCLWMLWDKNKQTLQDKVGGTVVIRTVK